MQTFDYGTMIVEYNFVVSVLIMLASGKLASYAGYVSKAYRTKIVRLTHVSILTVGAGWAVVSGSVYVAFHVLRLHL